MTLANINATSLAGKNLVETFAKETYDPKAPESGWFWDFYALLEASTQASRTSEEFVEDLLAAILGGEDTCCVTHERVLPGLTATLGEVKTTIVDASAI